MAVTIPPPDDGFFPSEEWKEEIENHIRDGETEFEIEMPVTWEDDDGWHEGSIHIDAEGDSLDDILSAYWEELRDFMSDHDLGSDEVGFGA